MRVGVALLVSMSLAACGAAEKPAAPEAAAGEETVTLRFALCASNVVSVDRAQSPGAEQLALHVGLTPDAAAAFAALTSENVGRDLVVVIGDQVFLAAPIPAPISSGVITAAPLKAEDAERLEQSLASLPPAPCGVASATGS
jgi:preprotein translocase subunit SecD